MQTPKMNPLPSVLVIDDDELSIDVHCQLLRTLGIEKTQVATDGRKAVQLLAAMDPTPAFIVCDVFMPELDGIEFLNHLASQKFMGGVIIVSGGDAQMLQLSAQIARANGLNVLATLIKPLTLEQMAQVLGVVLP